MKNLPASIVAAIDRRAILITRLLDVPKWNGSLRAGGWDVSQATPGNCPAGSSKTLEIAQSGIIYGIFFLFFVVTALSSKQPWRTNYATAHANFPPDSGYINAVKSVLELFRLPAPAAEVPEGFQLVPKSCNRAQQDAIIAAVMDARPDSNGRFGFVQARAAWDAALAAAPQPNAKEEG